MNAKVDRAVRALRHPDIDFVAEVFPDARRNALRESIVADAPITVTSPPRPSRRPRRRVRVAVVLALLVVAVATGAVARNLLRPADLAAGGLACYSGPDPGASVSVLEDHGSSPLITCAHVLHRRADMLIACSGGRPPSVSVFEIRGRKQCHRLGLSPLPASYARAHVEFVGLERRLARIEARRDCIPPTRFAHEIAPVLANSPYAGYRIRIRSGGRCGTLGLDGAGRIDLTGALDTHRHQLYVFTTIPRSLSRLLDALNARLRKTTGLRCLTPRGVEALVRRELSSAALRPRFALTRQTPQVGFSDSREARYAAGCAVVVDVSVARPADVPSAWRRHPPAANVWIVQRKAALTPGSDNQPPRGAYH